MNEHPEVRAKRLLREAGYNHVTVSMKSDIVHFQAKRFTRNVSGILIGNNIRVKFGTNAVYEIYFEHNVSEAETLKQAIQFAKRYYCLVKVADYIPHKEQWKGLKYIKPKDRRQPRIVNVLPTSKLEDILKTLENKE